MIKVIDSTINIMWTGQCVNYCIVRLYFVRIIFNPYFSVVYTCVIGF